MSLILQHWNSQSRYHLSQQEQAALLNESVTPTETPTSATTSASTYKKYLSSRIRIHEGHSWRWSPRRDGGLLHLLSNTIHPQLTFDIHEFKRTKQIELD
jgi:hypothetical protein